MKNTGIPYRIENNLDAAMLDGLLWDMLTALTVGDVADAKANLRAFNLPMFAEPTYAPMHFHPNYPTAILNGYSRTLTPVARARIARMARSERRYIARHFVKSGISARKRTALEIYNETAGDK